VTFASVLLLGLVAVLVVYDWASLRGKNRRALYVETAAFVLGAFFIAFPNRATELAHVVGIGRGVDFLLYPIVIWLVRESLLTRRRRLQDEERLTELTRVVAILEARPVKPPQAEAVPPTRAPKSRPN
jgi:small membrane protein